MEHLPHLHPMWADGTWSRFVQFMKATQEEQNLCWEYLALLRMRKMLKNGPPQFEIEFQI